MMKSTALAGSKDQNQQRGGNKQGVNDANKNGNVQQQVSQNDWEWEKDNYLIKDIRDLLADSAPPVNNSSVSGQGMVTLQPPTQSYGNSKLGQGHLSVDYQQTSQFKRQGSNITTNFSADQQLSLLRPPGGPHYPGQHQTLTTNNPATLMIQSQQSQGSFRGPTPRENESPNRNVRIGGVGPFSSSNFRHTNSSGQIWQAKQAQSARGQSDLKPQNNSTNKRDPIIKQIEDQNNHVKHQQKTQEEFLYQYIKEFQDAMAGKEAFKRQQMQDQVNQQRRSRRGNAVQNTSYGGTGQGLMQASGTMTLNESSLENEKRTINAKSELHQVPSKERVPIGAVRGEPQRRVGNQRAKEFSKDIERGWYGVTMKIGDKSGFRGHKHLIDKNYSNYPNGQIGTSVNYEARQQQLFDESIQYNNKSSLPQQSLDHEQHQTSKVEDSYLQELPSSNPLINIEGEMNENLDEFNSFDNRPDGTDGITLLPRGEPEVNTIQSNGNIEDDGGLLPHLNLHTQETIGDKGVYPPNFKYQTQLNGFNTMATSVRQSNKFHRRNPSGVVPFGSGMPIGDQSVSSPAPRLLKRRKSNFISVENQLQQTLNEIEEQQFMIAQKYQKGVQMNQTLTGRAAFISKNLAALQNNPLSNNVRGSAGFSSGLYPKMKQEITAAQNEHGRYIGSGGALQSMNRSLNMQDPLFDETINNASLSMSVKSNYGGNQSFHQRASRYQNRGQDELIMSMSESLDDQGRMIMKENEYLPHPPQKETTHLPSLGLSNKTPVQRKQFKFQQQEKGERSAAAAAAGNNSKGLGFVRESQRYSLPKALTSKAKNGDVDIQFGESNKFSKFPVGKYAQSVAQTSQVSPGRLPNQKGPQSFNFDDSLERANLVFQDYNIPSPKDDYEEEHQHFGPEKEILASASMVSSGGFIGDQYHQKVLKQRWRHLESFTNKNMTEKQPLQVDYSIAKKQPKQIAPISKTNVEWTRSMKEKNSNILKKGIATVDLDENLLTASFENSRDPIQQQKMHQRMKSTNFDSIQNKRVGTSTEPPQSEGITTFFKSKPSQALNPLTLPKKVEKTTATLKPTTKLVKDDPAVITLQKVKVTNSTNNPLQTPSTNFVTKNKVNANNNNNNGSSQTTILNNNGPGDKQLSRKSFISPQVVKAQQAPTVNSIQQQEKSSNALNTTTIKSPRNINAAAILQKSTTVPNEENVVDMKKESTIKSDKSQNNRLQSPQKETTNQMKKNEQKENPIINDNKNFKSITLTENSLMKNSQSNLNGRKSPVRPTPSRTTNVGGNVSPRLTNQSPNSTIRRLYREPSIKNNPADESLKTNFKPGQIIDFDVEHLLHPLREPCAKKMLCSCNNHAPRERTISPKKSPRVARQLPVIPGEPKSKVTESPKPSSPKPVVKTAEKSIETIEKQEYSDVAKMLSDVEWKETPVFKQHFNIKVTEAESLQGTQIGIRRYKELAKNKGKTMAQVALDLKDEKLRRQLLDQALKNVYLEPECQYLKKITTNRNLNDAQMAIVYEKALDTLEVLMMKFGLDEPFQRVTVHYETIKSENLRLLLLKVFARCLVMYESLGKIEVIFKLMRKRAELEQKFQDFDKNWTTDKKFTNLSQDEKDKLYQEKLKSLEQDVAQYCYQSCRLWVQISAFTFDHSLLNDFTFKFGGPEYTPLLRKQVENLRQKFGGMFGYDKIPLLDEDGRLYYDATEGVPIELVRIGGGFTTTQGPIGSGSQTALQRQSSMQRSPSQASSLNDGRNKLNSSALKDRSANGSRLIESRGGANQSRARSRK